MPIQPYFPVGTKENNKHVLIKKGDIIKLVTGEEVTFLKMNQKRFAVSLNGKTLNVPVWRDRGETKPFIIEKTGRIDESVLTKSVDYRRFEFGQLFALEGRKQTLMFVENKSGRGGSLKVHAVDLASGQTTTITPVGFTFVKIDLNKMKRELKG